MTKRSDHDVTSVEESTRHWARRYSSSDEYAAPEVYLGRRLHLFNTWGERPEPGSSVLQIGSGDGYCSRLLLEEGYRVTACDNSPEMLAKTEHANPDAIQDGRLSTVLLDINEAFPLDDPFDHAIVVMRHFFKYSRSPSAGLQELSRLTTGKMIIDVDPRQYDEHHALRQITDAGFRIQQTRAFLTPQKRKLPALVQKTLWRMERNPLFYRPLLKRKFHIWILAEKPGR